MVKVFISYSHADDRYRAKLETHLYALKKNGFIDVWSDRRIPAGQKWKGAIDANLLQADLILFLVSADFLDSDYCYNIEMNCAIERYERKQAIVIPIILRDCDWRGTPVSTFQALPTDGKAIRNWRSSDKALLNVTDGIKALLIGRSSQAQQPAYADMLSPERRIAKIREAVLLAKSEYDLQMAKFELEEYKKQFPLTFEVSQLEKQISDALQYAQAKEYVQPTSMVRTMWERVRPYQKIAVLLVFLGSFAALYLAINSGNNVTISKSGDVPRDTLPDRDETINGFKIIGSFKEHSYYISDTAATFREAELSAARAGGALVTISTREENEFICSKVSRIAWIGLVKKRGEREFRWLTGERLTFTSWWKDQPHKWSLNGPDVGVLINAGNRCNWQAVVSSATANFIIEIKRRR
jgi:TIR domain/Lectin C-type domain